MFWVYLLSHPVPSLDRLGVGVLTARSPANPPVYPAARLGAEPARCYDAL